jgi:type II secretory pathway component PulF
VDRTRRKREKRNLAKEGVRSVTQKQKMERNNRKKSKEINLKKLARFLSQRDNGMCIYDALGILRQHCGHISSLSSEVLAILKIVLPHPHHAETQK